jgi:hypothetical protein
MVRVLVAMDASLDVEVFTVCRLSCRNMQVMLMGKVTLIWLLLT